MTAPTDSIQAQIGGAWWTTDKTKDYRPGRLVHTWVPYIDVVPQQLRPVGRVDPHGHAQAEAEMIPFRISQRHPPPSVPVAGLTLRDGEYAVVQKGKVRPALVIRAQPAAPPAAAGDAKWLHVASLLVAPFFGADRDGMRAGVAPDLLDQVRWLKWPQFLWDQLPVSGSSVSLLRLDRAFTVGRHQDSVSWTEHVLSANAIEFVQQQFVWLNSGVIVEGSVLQMARDEFSPLRGP